MAINQIERHPSLVVNNVFLESFINSVEKIDLNDGTFFINFEGEEFVIQAIVARIHMMSWSVLSWTESPYLMEGDVSDGQDSIRVLRERNVDPVSVEDQHYASIQDLLNEINNV